MYQPYPTGAQMPARQRPPVPPSVANAVKVMYVGALTSLLGIVSSTAFFKGTGPS
jgi:hypothetical protein